jgi:hypothetical protein
MGGNPESNLQNSLLQQPPIQFPQVLASSANVSGYLQVIVSRAHPEASRVFVVLCCWCAPDTTLGLLGTRVGSGGAQARLGSATGGDSIRKVGWLPVAMQFLWSNTKAALNVRIGSIVGACWGCTPSRFTDGSISRERTGQWYSRFVTPAHGSV